MPEAASASAACQCCALELSLLLKSMQGPPGIIFQHLQLTTYATIEWRSPKAPKALSTSFEMCTCCISMAHHADHAC
jgi:hypothetical protein